MHRSRVVSTMRRIGGGLGAALCLMLPAWASAQPVDGVPSLKRYKIEALSFTAIDESGYDWAGSDEVMVETTDAKGWTVTNEIGDIDTGETHRFDPRKSCIVGVLAGVVVLGETSVCHDFGEPAPLSFGVKFIEKDFGLPVSFEPGFPESHHWGPHPADDANGDDFLGRARVNFSVQELEAALPHVGDEVTETVPLHLCPEHASECVLDAEYSFTFRVTRMPDAVPTNHLTRDVNSASAAKPASDGSPSTEAGLLATEAAGAETIK